MFRQASQERTVNESVHTPDYPAAGKSEETTYLCEWIRLSHRTLFIVCQFSNVWFTSDLLPLD